MRRHKAFWLGVLCELYMWGFKIPIRITRGCVLVTSVARSLCLSMHLCEILISKHGGWAHQIMRFMCFEQTTESKMVTSQVMLRI